MPVLINKWDGEQFEAQIRCGHCDQQATVIELAVGDNIGFVCKRCLLEFVADIDQAILEEKISCSAA